MSDHDSKEPYSYEIHTLGWCDGRLSLEVFIGTDDQLVLDISEEPRNENAMQLSVGMPRDQFTRLVHRMVQQGWIEL